MLFNNSDAVKNSFLTFVIKNDFNFDDSRENSIVDIIPEKTIEKEIKKMSNLRVFAFERHFRKLALCVFGRQAEFPGAGLKVDL